MPRLFASVARKAAVTHLPDGPSLNAAIEKAYADNAFFLGQQSLGGIAWSGNLSVDSGGTNTTFSVNVGAINSVVTIDTGAISYALPSTGTAIIAATTIGLAEVEGAPVSLSADSWYYVYVIQTAGAEGYLISTNGPDASNHYSSATLDHRYLGSFRTVTGGDPLPMRAKYSDGRGFVRYNLSGMNAGGAAGDRCEVLTAGTATSWTDVDLSDFVPPNSRLVHIRFRCSNSNAVNQSLQVRTKGETLGYEIWTVTALGVNTFETTFITDTSQVIQYQVTNANLGVNMTVLGYEE